MIGQGRHTFKWFDYVMKYGSESMKNLFKKYNRSIKSKKKSSTAKSYYSKKQKQFTKEYNFVCRSLESDAHLDLVKILADKLKVSTEFGTNVSPVDSKRILCDKITKKIIFMNLKPRI